MMTRQNDRDNDALFFSRPILSNARSRPHHERIHMPNPSHSFAEGDRVRARNRPVFPDGTVLRGMDLGYLLIRWDNNLLETAHCTELASASEDSRSSK